MRWKYKRCFFLFSRGLEAIVLDYARPIVVGTVIPKVAFLAVYLLSAATLAGLFVLIYNGPGLTKVIKHGWAIGKERKRAAERDTQK